VLRLSRLKPDWLFSTLLHRRIYGNAFVYILVMLNKSIVTSASIVTRRGNALFSLLSDNCRRVSGETPIMSQYIAGCGTLNLSVRRIKHYVETMEAILRLLWLVVVNWFV
jgi:hypothetical protein